MRPSPPSHPSAQQSPHSQPPPHGQILSNQVHNTAYNLSTYCAFHEIRNSTEARLVDKNLNFSAAQNCQTRSNFEIYYSLSTFVLKYLILSLQSYYNT